MPILKLQDFKIVSPSPDNFILRLRINDKDYNYIGSGEHVYQELDENEEPAIHKSLITNQLAHSSIFEYDDISTNVTAWDMFDINDVGVTTDSDDEDNDNLLLLQNSNIDPKDKEAIPLHQINSNSVYGFVSAINNKSIGVPKVNIDKNFNLEKFDSDPITRYHHRPMAVALSSVLGLGTQMNFADTFDKLFVFDPTDNNRLKFSTVLTNWRRYQSNRDKSSYKVTNNFDFGKLLVRTVLFPKATLNNEYSTERQYTDVSSPYAYMRKYAWDDKHFYSNGSFIVLNSREDNCFEKDSIDVSAKSGTMVTSKYSRRFGDVVAELNEVSPPYPPEIELELSDNTVIQVETNYNKVDPEISSNHSDIFENGSSFKQYMPESINRENETASDTNLMTSKHKANIFDVDIKTFWYALNSSINAVPSDVRDNVKDMIKKNLYEMIENIKPAHTKLYKIITNDEGDDIDSSSSHGPTPTPEKKIRLIFKANGGRYYNDRVVSITRVGKVGEQIGEIPKPKRRGYIFEDFYIPEVPETFPENNEIYYAQWRPISYIVEFHFNPEDEEDPYTQTFIYDAGKELSANQFTRDYYEFLGWSELEDASIVDYADKAIVKNLTTEQGETIDLYAVWDPSSFIVSFDPNSEDVSGSMDPQIFKYNVPQKLNPNRFIKEHYDFIKWIGPDGMELSNTQTITSLTSNITLSAQWDLATYTVYFNANGGTDPSGEMDPQTFRYGEEKPLKENKFVKQYYTFDGWEDSNGNEYVDKQYVSLSSNLNLYAQWVGIRIEITFNGGEEAEGFMDPLVFRYGDRVSLPPNAYIKNCYDFVGWLGSDGLTYQECQEINGITSDISLTAQWDVGTYTVSFNKNAEDATGSMDPQIFEYYDQSAKLPPNEFERRPAFEFDKWTDISGNEYSNEQEMSSYIGGSIELSAQWKIATYYVEFDGNGAIEGSMDPQAFEYGVEQELAQNTFTRYGWEFDGWDDADSENHYNDCEPLTLSSNMYLVARWNRLSSKLTFYKHNDLYTTVIYKNGSISSYNIVGMLDSSLITNLSDAVFVEVGKKVTSISGDSFRDCSSLTSVVLHDEVSSIGENAFRNSGLTSISLPSALTRIEESLFEDCFNLSNITIQDGVTDISGSVFKNCSNLSSISLANTITSIGEYALSGCSKLEKFSTPGNISSIENGVFKDCSKLSDVLIPVNITAIGDSAFEECSSMISVDIPNGVTSIGESAFSHCSSLQSVNIPNNISSLEQQTFADCASLSSITIPSNITSIGNEAFISSTSLSSITCLGTTAPTIAADAFGNDDGNYTGWNTHSTGMNILYVPEGATGYESGVWANPLQHPDKCGFNIIYGNDSTIVTYRKPYDSLVEYLEFDDIGQSENSQFINTNILMKRNRGYDAVISECSNSCVISSDPPPGDNGWVDIVGTKWDSTRATIYMRPSLTNDPTVPSSVLFHFDYESAAYLFTNPPNDKFDTTIPRHFGIIPYDNNTKVSGYIETGAGTSSIITCNSCDFPGPGTEDDYIYIRPRGDLVRNGANSFRIHSIQIHEYDSNGNGTLIFDGHPARLNGAGCIYDTVSKRLFENSGIKTIAYGEDIPDSIPEIVKKYGIIGELGEYSIPNKENAVKVEIGKPVTSIGDSAFTYCSLLSSVEIPNTISSIGNESFFECTSLPSIDIPNGVTSIGESAFKNCTDLSSVSLPNTLTDIEKFAFQGLTSLISIDIPSSVTNLGQAAVAHCSSLTSLIIPDSVSAINKDLCYDNKELISVIIPSSITSIGSNAFEYCPKLSTITCLAMTAPTVESDTFGTVSHEDGFTGRDTYDSENNKLYIPQRAIGYESTGTAWKDILLDSTKCGFNIEYFTGPGNTLVTYRNGTITSYSISGELNSNDITNISDAINVEIGTNVTSIGTLAFASCSFLSSVSIPDTVTNIGNSAFQQCSGLISVSLPSGITNIGTSAFTYCVNLESIQIPINTTNIGDGSFNRCYKLSSIEIPSTLTSIGRNSFNYCESMTSIIVDQNNSIYDSRNDCNAIIQTANNTLIRGCQNTIIPNSVTSIGDHAFEGNRLGLTSISIPNSISSIDEYAFHDCTKLLSVDIPYGISTIEEGVFESCTEMTSIMIPSSITSIKDFSFNGCLKLSSITCLATTAPTVHSHTSGPAYRSQAFGDSQYTWTGYFSHSTQNNVLKVPQGATGYTSSYWNDPLQSSWKCGFHVVEIN